MIGSPIQTQNDMEGYVKLYRKFAKWGWYQKSEMVHLFIHFLLLANHEDREWQGQPISRGQFITGRNSLSVDTGISPQTIRTCMGRLKSTNEITIKSTNKFSLISIVKWEDYQVKSTTKLTTKLTNNQPTTNQQLTTNKNDKNIKNDKNNKEEELPHWLNKEIWTNWLSYRKEQRKPLTAQSIKLQLKELEKDVPRHTEILEQSIKNGWVGLFPLKDKKVANNILKAKENKYAKFN